jgi:hypothetical protein
MTINPKDSDFLIWMAKRLVYKYRENPDIIKVVDQIISSCSVKNDIYEDFITDISSSIENIIESINQNKQALNNSFLKIQQKIKTKQENILQNSTFDDLDVESLFK